MPKLFTQFEICTFIINNNYVERYNFILNKNIQFKMINDVMTSTELYASQFCAMNSRKNGCRIFEAIEIQHNKVTN